MSEWIRCRAGVSNAMGTRHATYCLLSGAAEPEVAT